MVTDEAALCLWRAQFSKLLPRSTHPVFSCAWHLWHSPLLPAQSAQGERELLMDCFDLYTVHGRRSMREKATLSRAAALSS